MHTHTNEDVQMQGANTKSAYRRDGRLYSEVYKHSSPIPFWLTLFVVPLSGDLAG